ncbi:MAG: TIGR02221 family CRISPR-associated protein [Helicobacteraceae bacterium]|nr:TIGR02221 family CRISPR-associated protein [Helicobacteraceae bacterium]
MTSASKSKGRKTLISLLGTGRQAKGEDAVRYETTDYSINGKLYRDESFVAIPIVDYYKIDRLFLIGTTESMWDEIADKFSVDESARISLLEKKEKKSLTEADLTPINNAIDLKLGKKGSQCILIKEGVNNDELWEIFERFIGILDTLGDSDELYLDVTHLFRSLSVMAFVMIEFGLSYKRFKVKGVFYGQLNKDGPSPIINLAVFFEFLEWSKAINNLNLYGNGHNLNALLQNSGESKEVKNAFSNFSNALSVSDMSAMQTSVKILKGQIESFRESKDPIVRIISKQLIKFIARFNANDLLSDFQFNLAKWYCGNNSYAMAYIALVEAAVSAECERLGKSPTNREARVEAKDSFFQRPSKSDIRRAFSEVVAIRNNIAHKISADSSTEQGRAPNPKDSISNFEKYLSTLKQVKRK